MQQITVFGDIHGNLPALQAVLADIEARGLNHTCYCLGDLVGYGTFPNEVIALIRERGFPTIMGNYDQGVGHNSDDCGCAYRTEEARQLGNQSIAWSNRNTSDENKAFLRDLPAHISLQLGPLQVMLAHGSPRRVNEYLYEDRPDSSLERIMDQARADVLVVGHTHKPYHRLLAQGSSSELLSNVRHVVNAGSVGKPKDDDPRACYVVLSFADQQFDVEFIRVPYDVEKAARAIEATTMPGGMPHEYAQMLREGRG